MKRSLLLILLFLQSICFSSEAILLFGSPGSGKGTLSQFAKAQGYGHISAGDVIRAEIQRESELGLTLKQFIERGDFIDSDVLFRLVKEKIMHYLEQKVPVIIDGYGRTTQDWQQLRAFLHAAGVIPRVLILDAPASVCKDRMMTRLVCLACGHVSNTHLGDSVGSLCPGCRNAELVLRVNDTESVIDKRLKQYVEEVEPELVAALIDVPKERYDTNRSLEECLSHYARLFTPRGIQKVQKIDRNSLLR